MRFFEKCRHSFYFHGGRLIKDAKTQKQVWRLNLVITLKPEEVISCGELIQNNYEAIETLDNRMEEIKIASSIDNQVIEFFALEDHKAPVLTVKVDALDEMRMTRIESLTELWVRAEIENTDRVHMFVREHVFTRLWATFAPAQGSLELGDRKAAALAKAAKAATDSFAKLALEPNESVTFEHGGQSATLTAEDVGRKKKKPN